MIIRATIISQFVVQLLSRVRLFVTNEYPFVFNDLAKFYCLKIYIG